MKIGNRELIFAGVFLLIVLAALLADASRTVLTSKDRMIIARETPWYLTVREWLWEPVIEELIFRGPLWLFLVIWPRAGWKNIILWLIIAVSTCYWVDQHGYIHFWTMAVTGLGACFLLVAVQKSELTRQNFRSHPPINYWGKVKPLFFVIVAHQSLNIFSSMFSFALN